MENDTITIKDLEVYFCVGVTEEERAKPQPLQITIEMRHDFARAAARDDLSYTVNYFDVAKHVSAYGEGKSWKLIETLVIELANLIRKDFGSGQVAVEVKKFILRDAKYVSVRVVR